MTDLDASDKLARRHAAFGLLLICLLGLGLRIYHVLVAVAISPDSAIFVEYARRLGEDPLAALEHYSQHPLYPALILLFHQPVGWLVGDGSAGWILAGRLAAIAGSLAAIFALYWFTARLYDRQRGLLAAAMLAVLPDACQYGANVLTDLPHLALYLVGLAALLTGLQRKQWAHLLIAAAAAALAFLTRPEGGAVLLVAVIALALQRSWPLKQRIGRAAAMVGVFFCLAGPYQLLTGKLVQKKSLLELLKFGVAVRVEPPATVPATLKRARLDSEPGDPHAALATNLPVPINVLRQWARAGRVIYVLLAILGVVVARPRGVGKRIIALALGSHLALLYALQASHGYLDRRHALILITLSLPIAAAGMWWLAGKLVVRFRQTPDGVRARVAAAIVALCALGTSPWLLRPINAGNEHVVASGRWLAAHTEPGTLVVGDSRLRRVALYADRPFAEWPWWQGSVRHLAKFLSDKPASYFVVDVGHITKPERNPAFFEELGQQLGERLELVHTEPAPADGPRTEIRIYRYRAQG
jgi:hypothetical protein